MRRLLSRLAQGFVAHCRRQSQVSALGLMTDHLLADMGLRREQLDLLRLPEPPSQSKKERAVGLVRHRPSVQGCG